MLFQGASRKVRPVPKEQSANHRLAPTPALDGDQLLERFSPERIERYGQALKLLERRSWSRHRAISALAAVALSEQELDPQRAVAVAEALALAWRSDTPFLARWRSGLSSAEALLVAARLKLDPEEPSVPELLRVHAVVAELRAHGFHRETCRPTIAARLLAQAPDAQERKAWLTKTQEVSPRLRRLHPWRSFGRIEALLFSLTGSKEGTPEELVFSVERIYAELKGRLRLGFLATLSAAVVLAARASEPADEASLVTRFCDLVRRARREHGLARSPWVKTTSLLAVLTAAGADIDVSIGLLLAAQRQSQREGSAVDPILCLYLLVDQVAAGNPDLTVLAATAADLLVREMIEVEAAVLGTVASAG